MGGGRKIEHLSRFSTDLEPNGLAMMTEELNPNAQVKNVQDLVGGARAVYLIELADGRLRQNVVLKRFPLKEGSSKREWDALCFAHSVGLSCPTPLLYDDGAWFGTPSILMSALSGSPCLDPTDIESWTVALADVLAAIHATPVDSVPVSLHRPGIWERWEASGLEQGPQTDALSAALAELRVKEWDASFCHCDFHPGNVLFYEGTVAGVVDWASAKSSPFLNDLGRLRAALAIRPGGNAPDLVTVAYQKRTSRSLEGLAYWDVLAGAITLENVANWRHLEETAQKPLAVNEVSARISNFINTALDRLGFLQ